MLNPDVNIASLVFHRDRFTAADWRIVVRTMLSQLSERQMSLVAAGVAFFAMLALFPAITATISLFGYVSDPAVVKQNLDLLEAIVPAEVFRLIDQQVTKLVTAERGALGIASIFGLLLAVWSARAGVTAMIAGLNLFTRDRRSRNFVWGLVTAYLMTLLLIGVTLIAIASVVVIPAILAFFPLGGLAGVLVDVVRWALAVVAVLAGIGMLYRYGPSRRHGRTPLISIGSVLASLLWIVVSVCFSIYLANFGSYNEIYGSLGAVIALLMWFYLSALVVLFGGALNAEIEARAIEVIRARYPEMLVANSALSREMAGERD